MLLSETTFDFKEVLEGSVVSHDFIVWNTGNAVLKIDQTSPIPQRKGPTAGSSN
jgi:hypothetical protein